MATDLVKLQASIRAVAEGAGALVLEAAPDLVKPLVVLQQDQFEALIGRVQPAIVYLSAVKFDADVAVAAAHDEGDDELPAELDQLRRRAARHNGEVHEVAVSVFAGGVQHLLVHLADWYETFDDELDAIVDARRQADYSRVALEDAAEDAALRETAAALADHPAFGTGRPSQDKRRALCRALFSDLDSGDVFRVTELADELLFLKSNGVVP